MHMHMSIGESLMVTVLGMSVVFIVLIILNVMIKGLSVLAIYVNKRSKSRAAAEQAAVSTQPARVGAMAVHTRIDTNVRLYDVDVKTAAMVMAIVAHQTNIPINELRFRSIRAI